MGDGGLNVTVVVALPQDVRPNRPVPGQEVPRHAVPRQSVPNHEPRTMVAAPHPQPLPQLAFTGAPVTSLLLLAAVLLASGALLLAGARRRTRIR